MMSDTGDTLQFLVVAKSYRLFLVVRVVLAQSKGSLYIAYNSSVTYLAAVTVGT